ncbi:MAG TPA: hypothetical protein PLE79_07960, partial [Clostridia bacterium]|nr:hypothetical protein [Clostridia bacterium]
MMESVQFSLYKAALLLDAYLKVRSSCSPKSVVAKMVSEDMRKMAANAGMAIDETYLSKAEVLDQMVRMESAYIGLTIRKPAKRVYSEIVALYK